MDKEIVFSWINLCYDSCYGIRFPWDFLYHEAMNEDRFEQLKSNKGKEAQKFYEDYHVEFDKGTNPVYYPVYPYFSSNEDVEKKTVKLSNSTTPMACY